MVFVQTVRFAHFFFLISAKRCVSHPFFFFFFYFGPNRPVQRRYWWLLPIRTDSALIGADRPNSARVGPTQSCVNAYRAEEKKKKKRGRSTDTQAAASLAHLHVRCRCGGRFAASVHPRPPTTRVHPNGLVMKLFIYSRYPLSSNKSYLSKKKK